MVTELHNSPLYNAISITTMPLPHYLSTSSDELTYAIPMSLQFSQAYTSDLEDESSEQYKALSDEVTKGVCFTDSHINWGGCVFTLFYPPPHPQLPLTKSLYSPVTFRVCVLINLMLVIIQYVFITYMDLHSNHSTCVALDVIKSSYFAKINRNNIHQASYD